MNRFRSNQSASDDQISESEKLRFEPLEPRVLFSATAIDPVEDQVSSQSPVLVEEVALLQSATPSDAGEGAGVARNADQILRQLNLRAADDAVRDRVEIVFIADDLEDDDVLLGSLDSTYEVHRIRSGSDGVEQIAAVLAGRSGVDAIHIVSHGESGRLLLGDTVVDSETMVGIHADAFGVIGASLSADADILIYGCDFGSGEAGESATALLARITGADVAASDDKTGNAGLGGDWVLETSTGEIEAASIAAANWNGVLAPAVLTVQSGSLTVYDGAGNPVAPTTSVGQDARAVWANAGTVGSDSVDLVATVTSINSATVVFQDPAGGTDDAAFTLTQDVSGVAGNVTIEWSVVLAGTNTLATGDITFTIGDIDGIGSNPYTRETVTPSLNGLTAFGANDPTNIEFEVTGGSVRASGTENENTNNNLPPTEPEAAALFTWRNVSSWEVTYELAANGLTSAARFTHDGDGDFVFPDLQTTNLLGIDLDDNDTTATGVNYLTMFNEGGSAVAISDVDTTITQNVALGANLDRATVVLTNAQTGDELLVNGSSAATGTISGVDYTITYNVGSVEIEFVNAATPAVYQALIESITFRNNTAGLSGVDRIIEVTVFNDAFGTTSDTAISTIEVNRRPVANPATTNTPFQTPVQVPLTANDSDPDGDAISLVAPPTLVNPAHGSLALQGGNWVFTPATGFSGTAVINYTIQDVHGVTASSTHNVVVENAPPVLGDPDPTPGGPFINPLDATNLIVPAVDNVALTLDLDDYITDPNGEVLNFAPNLAGLPGWLSYNATTHAFSGTPPVDNVGSVTIPVTVTDGNGGSFVGSITINPVNPGPTANPDSVTTPYGTPVTVNLLANDTDPDGDPLQVQGTPTVANPAHGTIALQGGNWVFTPATGFSGTAVINYTIIDQDGATSSSTHSVVVENAPPVLADPDPTAGTPFVNPSIPTDLIVPLIDNVPFSMDLDDYITDPNSDVLTFTPNMTGIPAWITYNAVTHQFSGTPPIDNMGPVSIPLTVTDGNGGTFTGTVTISPNNPGPVANPQTVTTAYATPIALNLTGNDFDSDGDLISILGTPTLANPAHGSLSFAGGNWIFTPATGFSGTAVINYSIVDGDGATASSTHSVVVENAPPVLADPDPTPGTPYVNPLNATNLIVPAVDNVPFIIDLDQYITDPNGDPLTFTPNLAGMPGWLTYNPATHVFSGTPPVDNVGPVTISLTVTDGNGGSFAGSVTFDPQNPGPVANTASVTTPYGTPVVVNLLGNDTDPDGDPLQVQGTPTVANPAHGTIALQGGNWVFTPATGFSGTAVINYTIVDQDGATSSSTHNVVVENAPPVLGDPDPTPGGPFINPLDSTNLIVPAVDNVALTLDLDDYITDPNGEVLNFAPNLAGLPGWLSYNATTHTFSGTPPVDNAGPVTIPLTVTDGNGGSFVGSITINPVNPGPTANPDSVTTPYGTPVTVNLLGNDTDPDGDPLQVQGTPNVANPAHGTIALQGGNWVFTPATGFSGTAVINYTIIDQDGATSSSTHSVVVENAPPVLGDPDPTPGTPYVNPLNATNLIVPAVDNVPVSIDLDSYITDANGDVLNFVPNMTGIPAWVTYNAATHVFSGTPPVDNAGPVTIPITVTDGNGGTFIGSVTIDPVNPAPVANPQTVTTPYATPIALDLTGNDVDPDGDPVSILGTPSLVNPAHGSLSFAGGSWIFTPATGFSGTAVINYTVADQDGATSSSTHTVVVENAPPVLADPDPNPNTPFINPLDATNLIVPGVDNVALTLDLDDYISDPNGDTLTFTPNLAALPAWLSYNATTHVFTGTPPVDNAGPVTIPLTVTDGNGGSFVGSVTFDPQNPGPVANPDSVTTPHATPVTVNLLANDTDPDGDPLQVQGTPTVANPAHGTVALQGGNWVFTPTFGFSGTAVINYTIVDQDGATSSSTHNVVVENAPPVLGDPDPTPDSPYIDPLDPTNLIVPAVDNIPFLLDLDDYVTDPNGGTLNFAPDLAGLPAWLNYNAVTHVFSGTPPVDNMGPVHIPLTVTDGNGGSFVGCVTFDPQNPAPVANPATVTTPHATPVTVNLLANDTDPDGDPLQVQGTPTVANPAHGTIALQGGNWVFTPTYGFSGTAVINYTIVDQDGATSSSTHDVVVENAPPVLGDPDPADGTPFVNPQNATNLIVPAVDGTPFVVDLDDYITDPNPDVLTFTPDLTGVPAWLSYDPMTHQFSGTPPVDNMGPVTIPITVTDGNGGSFTGTITIAPENPGPVAVDDDYDTTQDSGPVVVGNALDNDSDPDGDPLSAVEETDVPGSDGGLFSIAANGEVTFDPNGAFDDLLDGETRSTTFTYTLVDQDGDTTTATVTVTVTGVNTPPDPNNGAITVTVGSRGGNLGLQAPTDPDGDHLTITVRKLPRVGVLRFPNGKPIKVGQVLTANQLERLVYDAPANYRGRKPVNFVYAVSDGQATALAKVEISIVSAKCYATYFPSNAKRNRW